jgi:hypothetical protein
MLLDVIRILPLPDERSGSKSRVFEIANPHSARISAVVFTCAMEEPGLLHGPRHAHHATSRMQLSARCPWWSTFPAAPQFQISSSGRPAQRPSSAALPCVRQTPRVRKRSIISTPPGLYFSAFLLVFQKQL